jgi:hypothetical protein
VYILSGTDATTGNPRAYIGEAEVIRERLKQHKGKEFWISAIVFVSKDENLTKAHVRYLESRILAEAITIGRVTLEQNQAFGLFFGGAADNQRVAGLKTASNKPLRMNLRICQFPSSVVHPCLFPIRGALLG